VAATRGRLRRLGGVHGLLVLALFVAGLALRLHGLGRGPLFIDEAESCLNALTILESGAPRDAYLGLPMFENTLTEPWPESEEYEFRDTSYSASGLAVYHGWLPLYAIAASLALHGIGPDARLDPPRVQHGAGEMEARIRAARLPAVLFGMLFLWAAFCVGRELYGTDAGLAALAIASLAPKCVWIAQQARYYSAALALGTLAMAFLLRLRRRGLRRDSLGAALALVALFHSSSLAFALVSLSSLALLPGILRRPGVVPHLALGALVVLAGIVPWLLWTGFLEHLPRIPMARELLVFPRDYLVYAQERAGRGLLALALLAAYAWLWMRRRALAPRSRRAVATALRPVAFLVGWTLVAYFGFQLLVPAASCSMARLSHALVAPPLFLVSIALAALARARFGPRSARAAPLGALLLLAGTGHAFQRQERNPYEAEAVVQLVRHLEGRTLAPGARVYALPYQHFSLTYLTGLPVQSIAPVRPEFLDGTPGEVWILETASRARPAPVEALARLAAARGVALAPEEAAAWVPAVQAEMVRAEVAPTVRSFEPPRGDAPAWIPAVAAELVAETALSGLGRVDYARDNPALFGGLAPIPPAAFWPAFFYRFVGPEARTGEGLNYAARMREAEASMLPCTWIVMRCPARSGGAEVHE